MINSFAKFFKESTYLLPHWVFMYGSSLLWELKNPKILYYNYSNLTKDFATYNDISEIAALTKMPKSVCLDRLNRGDLCHVVKDNCRIINTCWILKGRFYIRGQGLKYDTAT